MVGVTCLLHSTGCWTRMQCTSPQASPFWPCRISMLPPTPATSDGMAALHTTHDNASTCELPSSALQGSFVGVSVCHLRSYPGAFPDPRAASLYTVLGGGPPPPATCSCALQNPCTDP